MTESKIIINGKEVSYREAYDHWKASDTYKNAKCATRDRIFKTAIHGDGYGNHNPGGEVEHLAEAGIILK